MTIDDSITQAHAELDQKHQAELVARAAEIYNGQVAQMETNLAERRAKFSEYSAAEQAGIDADQSALDQVKAEQLARAEAEEITETPAVESAE